MEEKNKKCDCGGECACGDKKDGCACGSSGACSCGGGMRGAMCGCGTGMGMRHHFLLRIAIIIALLGFVFWSGVKIGELKMRFGDAYMMDGRGAYGR